MLQRISEERLLWARKIRVGCWKARHLWVNDLGFPQKPAVLVLPHSWLAATCDFIAQHWLIAQWLEHSPRFILRRIHQVLLSTITPLTLINFPTWLTCIWEECGAEEGFESEAQTCWSHCFAHVVKHRLGGLLGPISSQPLPSTHPTLRPRQTTRVRILLPSKFLSWCWILSA